MLFLCIAPVNHSNACGCHIAYILFSQPFLFIKFLVNYAGD